MLPSHLNTAFLTHWVSHNIVTFGVGCCILLRMGHPAGIKRDFAALEQRRLRAAKLLKQGWTEAEVAREVGVHRQSVNRWKQTLDAEGTAALKHPGRAGRRG